MSTLWQHLLVLGIIGAAIVYLVIYYIRRRKNKSACASCPSLRVLQDNRRVKTKSKSL